MGTSRMMNVNLRIRDELFRLPGHGSGGMVVAEDDDLVLDESSADLVDTESLGDVGSG